MKFSCLQENLSKGIQTVSRAIAPRAPMPILGNILLSAQDGKVKLAATNLETTIVTYVGASIQEEGSVTVPAKLLKDFLATLPAGTLNIHSEGDSLHVKSDKTKSKFNGISAEEYPELPNMEVTKNYLEFNPKEFTTNIALVAFAAGTDESRPIFTGVLLSYQKGHMTIASTDGFRLSEKLLKIDGQMDDFSVVIPSKTLSEISKVFASSQEPVLFGLTEAKNMIIMKSEDTSIATIALDGQYPDYKKIVPKESILSASFSTLEFLEAVKLTSIFAKETENNSIKIRFDPKGKLRVTSLAEESGTHESEIPAEIEGELMEIAFNSRYLLDYLNNVKGEQLNLKTNGNVSPCTLTSIENQMFLHIIMPIQI